MEERGESRGHVGDARRARRNGGACGRSLSEPELPRDGTIREVRGTCPSAAAAETSELAPGKSHTRRAI